MSIIPCTEVSGANNTRQQTNPELVPIGIFTDREIWDKISAI